MTSTERSEATRRLILETATRIFAECGYSNTSTAAIAKAAGLSQGIIFHYFTTKDALFSTIVRSTVESFRDCAAQACQQEKSAPDKLRSLMRLMSEHALSNPALTDLMARQLFSMQLNEANFETLGFREFLRMITETFDDGIRQGVFRDIDTQTATFSLLGLYVANYIRWTAYGRSDDFVDAMQRALAMLIDGIALPGATR